MLTKWRTLGYTGPAFVWTLQDRNTASTDPEDTFGVIRSDGTWKPAAYVIQGLTSQGAPTLAAARTALVAPGEAQPTPQAAATSQTPLDAAVQMVANSLAAAGQMMATSIAQATGTMANGVPTTAAPTTGAAATPTTIPAPDLDARQSIRLASDDAGGQPPTTRDERRAQRLSDRPSNRTTDRRTDRPVNRSETPAATATRSKDSAASAPKHTADAPKRSADTRDRSSDDRQKDRRERHRG